ncbi:acyl-binding protein, partial [Nannochloropsis gaditana CCMP526]
MVVTSKLRNAFTLAAKWVKEHHKEANAPNSVLFRLYGLYKRSTAGACNVRVPTMLVEPIARERYNSWKLASGLTEEQAMRAYLDLVRVTFPAFVEAAAPELKDLDDLQSVKEENRALLAETTEVLALYSKLQQ